MSKSFVEITTKCGKFPVLRFPARAKNWTPTESWNYVRMRSVTHLATGLRCGDALSVRESEILAVIFDYILPGETADEVDMSFRALPPELRKWVQTWRKGGLA